MGEPGNAIMEEVKPMEVGLTEARTSATAGYMLLVHAVHLCGIQQQLELPQVCLHLALLPFGVRPAILH